MLKNAATPWLRGARRGALVVAGVVLVAAPGATQARTATIELRPFVGAYIPTGDQRDLLRDAVLVGAQASYRVVPQLAITGTFAWSPSEDRVTPGDHSLDLFQYDLGVEGRAASLLRGGAFDFAPFAGIGLGARTYDYRELDVDRRTKLAGYGALGVELGFGSVGARFEARDYLSRFAPLMGGGEPDTRNDVTLTAGLTVRF